MNLRKLFALLMAAIMLLGMVPTTHAELADCNHDWDGGQFLNGTPANCTDWKTKTYTCTICGATREWEEGGPCVPGDKTWVVPQGSNCMEFGVWEITCKHCGEWLEGREEPGPHQWKTETVEPATCEDGGLDAEICSVCGQWFNNGVQTPALGHDWGSWGWAHGSAPTCTEGAWQVRSCNRCGRMEDKWVGAGDHQWGGYVTETPAGCETPGEEVSYCSVCGEKGSSREIPAKGHDWGDWKWEVEATCNQEGLRVRYCNRCNMREEDYVQGNDHDYGDWREEKKPTCTEHGLESRKCSRCGDTQWRNKAQIDHVFDEWYVVAEPQVGLPGLEQRDCTYGCGTFEQREIPALEQDFSDSPVSAEGLNLTLVLSSTPANGTHFVVGEEVTFTETWSNGTGKTLYPFSVSIFTCAAPQFGSEIDQICSWFAEDGGGPVAPGATGSHTLNVTVTEADVARGAIYAMAELLSTVQDGPDLENVTAPFVTAPCGVGELPDDYQDPGSVMLTLIEWSDPDNGTHYVPGEKINVYHRLSNNSRDVTMTVDHQHYFEICGDGIKEKDDSLYSKVLLPGTSYGVYFWSPTVTEADAARGYVERTTTFYLMGDDGNEYTATGSIRLPCGPGELPDDYVPPVNPDIDEDGIPNEEDPDVDGDGIPNEEDPNPNGEDPDIDDDGIPNDKDPDMDGDGIPNGEDPDIDGDGIPNEEDPTPDGSTPDADMGLSNGLDVIKTVTSTPANGSFYVPGDTVTYEVCVKNNGEPLNDLDVSDWMWGDEHAWVGSFATGEAVMYPVTHIVTDADARAKHVNNIACATAIDKDGNQITEYSNLVTVPCGFPEGDDPFGIFHSLALVKKEESLPLNGEYYTEGEVIHYNITYTNDGELPLTDVQVWDNMDINTTIGHAEMLQPGESRICYYQHTVTAEDVAAGTVLNLAQANYPVPGGEGYIGVNSNLVFSKTSADGMHCVVLPPLFTESGEDPEYDPGTGWFPPDAGEETPDFGTIDTDALHGGETYCVRTITGRDNVSATYETTFCTEHADTQSSALIMAQAAATPELQMQSAAYAAALWRTEVESLYQEIFEAADPTAKTVVMTEYVRFLTDVANYEAMLKILYPDQPALVAAKVATMWENKCIDLCYDAHATAAERKDSLLAVMPTIGAVAESCSCEVTAQETGKKTEKQSYCPVHSFPFSMIDALLQGNDTVESWTMVRQIWGVELTNAYNKIYSAMGENKLLAMAEYNTLTQWMMAREASLIALYPENPEVVAQIMVKTIMERVNELCAAVQ